MARAKPSAADAGLLDRLQELGFAVSGTQLERWRHIGVLPSNKRTYLGRGRGSTSEYTEASLEIAEAMAMTARRGRSIHEAILRIFTVNPTHCDLFEVGLPIPERAIRSSLEWFVRAGDQTLDRRIERRIRRSAASPDDAVEIARKLTAAHYRRILHHPPPASEHINAYWTPPKACDISEEASRLSIKFANEEEPGADIVADLIVSVFPSHMLNSVGGRSAARESLASLLAERETVGLPLIKVSSPPNTEETLQRISRVNIDKIRDTRDKLACVAEMGNIYVHMRGSDLSSSDIAREMSDRMLNATTESFDANALFYMTLPIASTLNQDAWHRMASLIIMVTAETDRGFMDDLDLLASAAMPHRFVSDRKL
jgi:hypothetical protein